VDWSQHYKKTVSFSDLITGFCMLMSCAMSSYIFVDFQNFALPEMCQKHQKSGQTSGVLGQTSKKTLFWGVFKACHVALKGAPR